MQSANFRIVQYVPGEPTGLRVIVGAVVCGRDGKARTVTLKPRSGIESALDWDEQSELRDIVAQMKRTAVSSALEAAFDSRVSVGIPMEVPDDVQLVDGWVRDLLMNAAHRPLAE